MAYTYDDFIKAAGNVGIDINTWSQQDQQTAKEHPEFGLSLLGLQNDYMTATNEEAKVLAHAAAEQLRSSYGSIGQPQQNAAGPGQFYYDHENDPVWQAYKKEYLREGDRASAQTLGQTAAMTGGIPSSYAETAAQEANNYYAGKLADKIPELYSDAFASWNKGKDDARNLALTIIQAGGTPSQDLLLQAGIDNEDARTLIGLYGGNVSGGASGGTGGGSGSGSGGGHTNTYNNGNLSAQQVMEMQKWLGVSTDGQYGQATKGAIEKAAGRTFTSADEAYAWYQNNGGGNGWNYDAWSANVSRSIATMSADEWLKTLTQACSNGQLTQDQANELFQRVVNYVNAGVNSSQMKKLQALVSVPVTGYWTPETKEAWMRMTDGQVSMPLQAWNWYLIYATGGSSGNIPK